MIATNPIARAGAPDLTDDTLVGNWCSPYGNNPWQDVSGHGYTGVPAGVTPESEGGIHLSGASSYISLGTSSNLNPTEAMTVSTWINPSSLAGNHPVLTRDYNGTYTPYNLAACRDGTAKPVFEIYDGGYISAVSSVVIAVGSWSLIVGRFNGSNLEIYVNGELRGSAVRATPLPSTASSTSIGLYATIGAYFAGKILDVRLISEAKSTTWIRELYKAGVPR